MKYAKRYLSGLLWIVAVPNLRIYWQANLIGIQSFKADACDIGDLLSNHDHKKLDIRIINANNLLQITPMKRNPLFEMQDG
jgi:hypothetical protein